MRYPFRLGSTSYVYPGDLSQSRIQSLIYNAERLVGQVDDVELVLFDTFDASNLPDADTVGRLDEIAQVHGLTYTVHLPDDLSANLKSVESAIVVIEMTRGLHPYAIVFHAATADAGSRSWTRTCVDNITKLIDMVDDPAVLTLENLESYPPEVLEPVFDALPIRRALDIGHLWKMGRDPLPVMDRWLPDMRVIHLHGLIHDEEDEKIDHLSLSHIEANRLDPVVDRLRSYTGVLTLEVFEDDFFTSRDTFEAAYRRVSNTGQS